MCAMNASAIEAIVHWLIDGARSAAAPDEVLAALCERLVDAGVPLWRAAVFVRTLHPHVLGRRFVWREGRGVEVAQVAYGVFNDSDFTGGILNRLFNNGTAAHRPLDGDSGLAGAPLLAELHREGATEFLASPLLFSDGTIHAATWATRRPGGFAPEEIMAIETLLAPLARMAEIWALRRTALNLLDTYIGHATGERILAGQIHRGDTQAIDAAIWLSDMRGFTALADRLPPQALIDLLNRYFDCQVPAILEHGGEVLKYMGDGVLAIFPLGGRADASAASCASALAAALKSRAEVARLRPPDGVDIADRMRFGLALHIGRVMYGNIGGGNRLDFTCIGPAVNLAARIEKLTSRLSRTILMSQDFVHNVRQNFVPLGTFSLSGFDAPQAVFGLSDE
jgi:adenylate cyclase